MTAEFDYVVVGAGSAGSIVAYRLSEAGHTVCVLEAGSRDSNMYIHIPAGFVKTMHDHSVTWRYESEPGPWTGGRPVAATQGRTLGGSGSVNGMVYIRGQQSDYDNWRQKGNRGWSYADVLPYFKRLERRVGPADDTYRGREGRLPVTDNDWVDPLCEAFIAGAVSLGYPRNPDYNGPTQFGTGYYQRAIEGFRRVSSARAFLYPAMQNGRVEVRTDAHASAVLLEGKRAVGVRYRRGGRDETVRARREVIVSSGTLNSPKLLQLSGIGPAALLKEHGVTVLHDLPGVGENLSDHFNVRIVARAKNVRTVNDRVRGLRLLGEIARWALRQPSVLSIAPAVTYAFGKSDPAMDEPDFTIAFTPASHKPGRFGLLDDFPGMSCGAWQQRPESIGHVRIRSADPLEMPLIQPNYLTADRDRHVFLASIRAARQILATPQMAHYYANEELPGAHVQSDDELLDFIRGYGSTSYHFVGSCRMAPPEDRTGVVDDQLKVRGIDALRVVDASIMPTSPSANTYVSSMMIAEKASDMILGKPALSRVEHAAYASGSAA